MLIRDGEIIDSGSWVYAWVEVVAGGRVVDVGATGLHPATRAWLHLHDPDPDIGRIKARLAGSTDHLEVVALRLPTELSRADTKRVLIARLAEQGLLSERYIGDPPGPADAAPECVMQADRLVAIIRSGPG